MERKPGGEPRRRMDLGPAATAPGSGRTRALRGTHLRVTDRKK